VGGVVGQECWWDVVDMAKDAVGVGLEAVHFRFGVDVAVPEVVTWWLCVTSRRQTRQRRSNQYG
jgi:hypothetical protein